MNDEQRNALSSMPPKTIFIVGLVSGALVLCTVGFFILLNMVMFSNGESATAKTPAIPTNPTTQGAAPAPTDIRLAAITNEDHVKGKRDARISIVEFSDTECPFCKRFHTTMQQVVDAYPDDVNWAYRHFPLTSLHRKAAREAEATECAGEQGKFWEYTDRLFEITPSNDGLEDSQLPQIAKDVGLNVSTFETCLESGKFAEKVKSHADQAIAAGGRGTPYSIIVVGDEKIPLSGAQPFEQIKGIIDSLL
jgi:protein-disulfide isomerase